MKSLIIPIPEVKGRFNRLKVSLTVQLSAEDHAWPVVCVYQSGVIVAEAPNYSQPTIDFDFETRLSYNELIRCEMHLSICLAMELTIVNNSRSSHPTSVHWLPSVQIKRANISVLDANDSCKYRFLQLMSRAAKGRDYDRDLIAVRNIVSDTLSSGNPLSLIRLGDGEGRLLGYPELFGIYEINDECLGYQYGPGVFTLLTSEYGAQGSHAGAWVLKQLILESMRNADIICCPSSDRFAKTDSSQEMLNAHAASAVSMMAATVLGAHLKPDHFMFYRFYELGFLDDLVRAADQVTLITHIDISDRFFYRFGVVPSLVLIPGHVSFVKSNEPQFPKAFIDIRRKIQVRTNRHLFLVGAGYLGKHYCDVIKKRGGVALDIGSLFDAWSGVGRREAVEKSDFRL